MNMQLLVVKVAVTIAGQHLLDKMSFTIINNSEFQLYRIVGQFQNFQNENCKLPSVYFDINYTNDEINNSLICKKQIDAIRFFVDNESNYWISHCDVYAMISKDYSIFNIYIPNNLMHDGYFEITNLLMRCYHYSLINNNWFMIHAAAVVINEMGILFCGLSGDGKSTQANLWNKYKDAWILNYDKPCIGSIDGQFIVHGSPWSGKERKLICKYAPIKAIVFVNKSDVNRVQRLSPAIGFSKLYLHNYVYPFVKSIDEKYNQIIQNVCMKIPIYDLYCDISQDAVDTLYSELFLE